MSPIPPGPDASVARLSAALSSGEVSAVELTRATLDRIGSVDGEINAWLRVTEEHALEAAERVDDRRASGEPLGPLAGIPVGVKDMICTRGVETTAASRILHGFVPPYDATVVRKLKEADAILVGKLNMDEFAMGSSNESSAYGPVRNPWDGARVPGGSSGGSAAAVASGTCPLALGTDTGGSIRQPASFCGVVGIKPTYGRVSRWGVIAFASSLDQVGPLARSVDDAALLLEVLCGHDPLDSTSIPEPAPSLCARPSMDLAGVRLGVPDEYFTDGMEPGVETRVREALADLEAAGCELVPVSLPHTRYAVAVYYLIATAEASSNLARYDGVRYGHRTRRQDSNLYQMYARTRTEGFGTEVKRRIILGTYALSSGYYDAYYLKAQKVRTLVRRDFEEAFARCDVLCAPTAPTTAFALGAHAEDPLKMYLMDIFTVPASLAGLPCLSLPCGLDGQGLPVGLQMMGPPLGERRLVDIARAYERLAPPLGEPSGGGS